jgi:hypothetical protein
MIVAMGMVLLMQSAPMTQMIRMVDMLGMGD